MMDKSLNILGIAGSLRKKSFNRALLNETKKLLPEHTSLEIFDLTGIPGFNQDQEHNPPQIIAAFKDKIKKADALLFACPEYNYSISGVLKNAMDWASRPFGDNSFNGKPAAIMGASIGGIATARAQYHLRQTFVFLNIIPINHPEVMIEYAAEKFDEEGNLTDEITKDIIRMQLDELVKWTKQIAL